MKYKIYFLNDLYLEQASLHTFTRLEHARPRNHKNKKKSIHKKQVQRLKLQSSHVGIQDKNKQHFDLTWFFENKHIFQFLGETQQCQKKYVVVQPFTFCAKNRNKKGLLLKTPLFEYSFEQAVKVPIFQATLPIKSALETDLNLYT